MTGRMVATQAQTEHAANHPLAVQRDFPPPDMPKRFCQRE